MNFCFDFLQELLMVWEAISNIRKGVSSDIQTPWSWLKKTRLRLVFSTTSRCLDIGWNTLPHVWYITSKFHLNSSLDTFVSIKFFKGSDLNCKYYNYYRPKKKDTRSWLYRGELRIFQECLMEDQEGHLWQSIVTNDYFPLLYWKLYLLKLV